MASTSINDDLAKQPGFVCFKTYAPIRYPRRWYRMALIDAALNPNIHRMGPSPLPLSRLPAQAGFSFWIANNGMSTLVVLSEAGCDISALAKRIPVRSVTRVDLTVEPTARLRREIWSHKRAPLPLEVLVDVLHEVNLRGRDLTLQEVRLIAGMQVSNVGPVIYAAIIAGYLEVDITEGWSPSIPVRLGPMAKCLLGSNSSNSDRLTPNGPKPLLQMPIAAAAEGDS